jgi:hypothetical protein
VRVKSETNYYTSEQWVPPWRKSHRGGPRKRPQTAPFFQVRLEACPWCETWKEKAHPLEWWVAYSHREMCIKTPGVTRQSPQASLLDLAGRSQHKEGSRSWDH